MTYSKATTSDQRWYQRARCEKWMVSSDTITDSRWSKSIRFSDAFFCKLITGQQWATNTRACTDRVTNSFGQYLVYALTCGQQLLPLYRTEQKTVNRKLEQTLCIIFIDLTDIDGCMMKLGQGDTAIKYPSSSLG